mgnify:CR=1 FL=1
MTDTNFIPLNTDLINMGGTATCSPNCGVCTGDCDGDVDCAGNLKCFQRESSNSQVPGCFLGGDGDVNNYDYCYDPSVLSGPDYNYDKMTVGNNGGVNCDTYCSTGWNNEAPVGSSCVKAKNKDGEFTGCDMTPGGDLTCYCKNPGPLINKGGTATCSPNCGVCTGDCDGDVDCAGDLKCFQRESSTSQVPGCFLGGDGDVNNYDYCYDPSVLSGPDYNYDKMTVGNNGGVNCDTYCSTGWNNEAPVGSSCVKAKNKDGEFTGCDMTPGGDLTCYCKNPEVFTTAAASTPTFIPLSFEPVIENTSMCPAFDQCANIDSLSTTRGVSLIDNDIIQIKKQFSEGRNINDLCCVLGPIELWNTSKVTDLSGLFSSLTPDTKIPVLDLSNWDVGNVVNMSSAFSNMKIGTLKISEWNVSNVTQMSGMFTGAEIDSFDISGWAVENVINMIAMFKNFKTSSPLKLGWSNLNVENMSMMFHACVVPSIEGIAAWNTGNVINVSSMFAFASINSHLDLTKWVTHSFSNVMYMFNNAEITSLDATGWVLSSASSTSFMFVNSKFGNLTIDYWDDIGGSSTWNTNSGTSYMFNGATITGDLSAVGLTCIKESNTLNFAFSGINVTGTLDLRNWNITGTVKMSFLFKDSIVNSLLLTGWIVPKTSITASFMFDGSTVQSGKIDLSDFPTVSVTNNVNVFRAFADVSLGDTIVNVSTWTGISDGDFASIFSGSTIEKLIKPFDRQSVACVGEYTDWGDCDVDSCIKTRCWAPEGGGGCGDTEEICSRAEVCDGKPVWGGNYTKFSGLSNTAPGGYQCGTENDRTYSLLSNKSVGTCQTSCSNDPKCAGYSYNSKNGNCWVQTDNSLKCQEGDIGTSPLSGGGLGFSYYSKNVNNVPHCNWSTPTNLNKCRENFRWK